jgi:hypothetical protein
VLEVRWTSDRLGRRCLVHAPTGAMLGWVGGAQTGWRVVSLLRRPAAPLPVAPQSREDGCRLLLEHVMADTGPGVAGVRPCHAAGRHRYALPDW